MSTSSDPRAGLKALLIQCCALAAATANAAPLTLEAAQERAIAADTGRGVFEAEAAAMRDRAVAAGQLPDPEARIAAINVPVDSLAFDREDMTMIEVGIMQRFPAGRSRELSRQQLEHHALHYDADAQLRRREVRLTVERLWRELDYLDGAIGILDEASSWIRVLIAGAAAAYESGAASQADLVDSRLAALAIEESLIQRGRDRETALAELRRWIGSLDPSRVAAPAAPRDLPGLEVLLDRLEMHPVLRALEHDAGAARIETERARARYKPAFGVSLGYGFRQGSDMSGGTRPDMMTAMLTFDLPLFTRDRQDRELSAARSMLRGVDARRDDARRGLESRLAALHATATALAQSLDLYETGVTQLATAGRDAALAAYRAGDGTLADVVNAQKRRLEVQDRQSRLRADLGAARAE
ncbi:MAG: TolC family protein, partial [Steroidobacteraceae bacterium]